MFREFLGLAVQKKSFLMFFTCVVYIIGLYCYFADKVLFFSILITLILIFTILKNYLSPKLALFWYFTFFFAFFNASYRVKDSDALYQISPQDAIIKGRIVSIPTYNNNKVKFSFDVSNIIYNGHSKSLNAKTLVNLYSIKDKNFNIGNVYQIKGKLRAPFEVSNPSQFDYSRYLRNFGIFTLFYANGSSCDIVNTKIPSKWFFVQSLNNIRNDIIQTHSKYLKSPNLELLGGIVFGDDAITPPDDIKISFQKSGLLHLLAASGMNVALIYGIWFFILRKLKVPFNLSVSSGIFIVIFYALMTGLGPSVIRAAFMLIFILIGKLIDRDAHSISLLAFVALLMLIYNPAYINDVGFQLSFIVTLGLLLMTPFVFEKTKLLPAWLSGAIFIPLIAQLWVAPIQMYYFNSFSTYSIFANIAILPFVTIVSFGGFISAVLALFKPFANLTCLIFDFVLNPVLNMLVVISDYFSNLPHSLIQTIQPNTLQIIIYYLIISLITLVLKIGFDKRVIFSVSILFILFITSLVNIPNHKLETIVFDVKNADAFLIKTPESKYFLIDSGKMAYNNGKTQAEMIVLSYLKDCGIKNIEGFIITHFDSDHAGGAVSLIKNLRIKNIYVNSLNDKSRLAKEIYANSKNKIKLVNNDTIIYREGKLTVKTFISGFKNPKLENENSVITLISDNNFDELFMGDSGIIAFAKIKNYLPQTIEVLKVGHHGAKNVINKSMLSKINPKVAIISTGLNNYGHPNPITLNILQSNKVKVLRTDRQNAIKIEEENNQYNLYSFNQNNFVPLR